MKEKIVFNHAALKTGDMVVCAGRSPFATVTRWVTAGRKNADNDEDVAVHTGMIIVVDGVPFIAEMQAGGFKPNSLDAYSVIGSRRWVIDIKRYLMTEAQRKIIRANVMRELTFGKVKYDFRGLLEFVAPRIDDRENLFYCSERYVHDLTTDTGCVVDEQYQYKVSPRALQVDRMFKSVKGWRLS